MKQHTPTPWKVSNYRFGIIARDPKESTYEKGDDKCPHIVTLPHTPQASRDAAFIITAVNAHYDLVTALKEALGRCSMSASMREEIQAALAKARGEA